MSWFVNRFQQNPQAEKPKEPPVRNEWPEPEEEKAEEGKAPVQDSTKP